jgi:peptidoglycan hydrolase-like amidase
VEAVKATRGSFITYDNAVVITPYFGHSNGKTKSWQQVWGGAPKPWLVSVKAGYDKGRKQFGHGVGMSQRDAAIRADKEKLDWQSLVKYYYKGVEIKQLYQ